MSKLAILIGVSEYADSKYNLPACDNDVISIKELLDLTNKYDDILFLNKNTNSSDIMSKIDDFIKNNDKKEVDELLFYYSGHGLYTNNEFYYITSDFDNNKINSTSISNRILDNTLKQLNPELCVKIIDACNSGTPYIKEFISRNVKEEIIYKSIKSFKNCYFISSSNSEQSSTASLVISTFTKSIFESLCSIIGSVKSTKSIKYRDLTNMLSDYFSSNEQQKPYFVLQGPLSEEFFESNDKIKDYINKFMIDKEESSKDEKHEIVDSEVLKSLPSKTFVDEYVMLVNKTIIDAQLKNKIIINYNYSIEIKNIKAYEILHRKKIGQWILENKSSTSVFAQEKYRRPTSEDLKSDEASEVIREIDNGIETVYVMYGFQSNYQSDISNFVLEIVSDKSLPKYCCQIALLFTPIKMFMYFSFYEALPRNWDEHEKYQFEDSMELNINSFAIASGIKNVEEKFNQIMNQFEEYSANKLKQFIKTISENE